MKDVARSIMVASLVLSGCSSGKKVSAVFEENAPRIEGLRRDLKLVAAALAVPADPKPCVKGNLTADHIEVMHYEHLTDPGAKIKPAHAVDLMLSTLTTCFAWFAPPAADELRHDDSEANLFESRVAKCAGRTHVLVARELSHDTRSATLKMRYDLVRIADQAVVCGFDATAKGDPTVEDGAYKLVERDTGKVVGGGVSDHYGSILWTAARNELVAMTRQQLGVTLPLKDDF